MNRHCIDCEWVRGMGGAGQSGGLFCHRFPPVLVSAREGVWSGWPEVRELDDCGEWAPTWKEKLREMEASVGMPSAAEVADGIRERWRRQQKAWSEHGRMAMAIAESLANDRPLRPDEEDKP